MSTCVALSSRSSFLLCAWRTRTYCSTSHRHNPILSTHNSTTSGLTPLTSISRNITHTSNAQNLAQPKRIQSNDDKTHKSDRRSRFVHSRQVRFRGGQGGDGCISMLSIFANEFAGPDGGNGGNGGHVVLRANSRVKSLNELASAYHAPAGTTGSGKDRYGRNAEHVVVDVPVGTVVTQAKPKELPQHEHDPNVSDVLAELDQHDALFIAARGGAGGRGNATYLSNANRRPRLAERGAKGEQNVYDLWLRIYAHVGLIGAPNVGKSTLLKTLTGANVKIGDYAFTTLHPQVGTIELENFEQLVIADLPGLIEESNKNRGLGVTFLRNVRKCVCLLYVIDLTKEPVTQLEMLWNELDTYRPGLSERPHLVMANKIDMPGAADQLVGLREYLASRRPSTRLIVASGLRGDNLDKLVAEMRLMFDANHASNADEPFGGFIW